MFGIDPRVRLLTMANGGEAGAPKTALRIAKGDMVVALDADTQFEPDIIAKLLRWFADPAVDAWRRAALDALGGYPIDMLAEDQHLTIAIQRAGWRIA